MDQRDNNWSDSYDPNEQNFIMVGESASDSAQKTQYYESAPEFNKRKKKEPKYITRKAFILTLIFCMIGTSALTIAGYSLASHYGLGGTAKTVSATNYSLAKATGSEKSIEEIIAQNENAVVEIRTESVSRDSWLQNYVTEGAGSGVIIDTKGYILTCLLYTSRCV